jgi:Holliday junction resolvase-like predicted endonuclease
MNKQEQGKKANKKGKNYEYKRGKDGKFKEGHVSWNAGRKGYKLNLQKKKRKEYKEVICQYCKKKFKTKTPRIFCSNKCRGLAMRIPRITFKCESCAKEISKTKQRWGNHKLHFCSNFCQAKYYRDNPGTHHNYKPKVEKTCLGCGKRFKVFPYRKNQLYCSVECSKTMTQMYKKGVIAERKARKQLELQGYYVIRSAGSRGIWDLVAFKNDEIKLVQIKSYRKDDSHLKEKVFGSMRKHEPFLPLNATQELWLWVYRKGWEILKP